jgi:hypothetical protein
VVAKGAWIAAPGRGESTASGEFCTPAPGVSISQAVTTRLRTNKPASQGPRRAGAVLAFDRLGSLQIIMPSQSRSSAAFRLRVHKARTIAPRHSAPTSAAAATYSNALCPGTPWRAGGSTIMMAELTGGVRTTRATASGVRVGGGVDVGVSVGGRGEGVAVQVGVGLAVGVSVGVGSGVSVSVGKAVGGSVAVGEGGTGLAVAVGGRRVGVGEGRGVTVAAGWLGSGHKPTASK